VCRALGFDLLRVTKCQLETVFLGRNQFQLLEERWFNEDAGSERAPKLAVVTRRAGRRNPKRTRFKFPFQNGGGQTPWME
jgi:hypothetical protein